MRLMAFYQTPFGGKLSLNTVTTQPLSHLSWFFRTKDSRQRNKSTG